PAASLSRISSAVMRVPTNVGFPIMMFGSETIVCGIMIPDFSLLAFSIPAVSDDYIPDTQRLDSASGCRYARLFHPRAIDHHFRSRDRPSIGPGFRLSLALDASQFPAF